MVFSSTLFLLLFLPVTMIVYFAIDKKYKNLWITLASFFFYAWGGLKFALIMLVTVAVNYTLGILMGSKGKKPESKRKIYLIISLIYNIGLLAFYKYFNFIAVNIESLIKLIDPNYAMGAPMIPLPIGISFFTFQIMSYVIDVYWGKVEPQKSFINLALYIMLFPQLIAGPIVRYIDIEKQIVVRDINLHKFRSGLERFVMGLGKKVFIANAMGSVANSVFDSTVAINTPAAWIGIIAYSLQIYYDFSAYSDMAIGLGKMFGFDFLENFNYPYIAQSIQDFWRRWHISLSSWFRDYLYIPLGGSRCSKWLNYRNLLIVFFVTGLWHGAAWSFIVWGLFHGFFLILEKQNFWKKVMTAPYIIRRCYTLIVVMIGWVFFRAETLQDAVVYIMTMFNMNFANMSQLLMIIDFEGVVMLAAGILFSFPIHGKLKTFVSKKVSKSTQYYAPLRIAADVCLVFVFVGSLAYVTGSNFNPFIYFRF